jgi:DedD protein
LAQDDYYYEIQLTNKQLVFYFLAGATGLVLSFLAGVMVGRGVDQTASAADTAQVQRLPEDRIVTEEPPSTRPALPAAEDLTYAQRLESDRADNTLAKPPSPGSSSLAKAPPATVAAPPTSVATPRPVPVSTTPAKPAPPATTLATAPAAATAGTFTIQVGAFKDRATADSMAAKLKSKGYPAYVMTPAGGNAQLFNVRVGSFAARPDAERVQGRLRDEEKFKPFIVRN